ncbi:MAG: energy transducer TonB [Bdellovibrionaceae bacterium]|nr:energy transducer TonB [Pseudobdellovibrionaceae bacterium]
MKTFSLSRTQKAILLSLALHLLLVLTVYVSGLQTEPAREVITMEIVETPPPAAPAVAEPTEKVQAKKPQPKDDTQKIVDQADKALNDEIDPNARFLSKNNQRVEKQTVAKNRGEFQNRATQGPQGKEGSDKPANPMDRFLPQFDAVKAVADHAEREKQYEEDAEALMAQAQKQKKAEVAEAQAKRDAGTGNDSTKGSDTSQTLDYIKDLDPGLETLLSSKEFKFYTYFSRVRTQLNQHWTPKVRSKVSQMYKKGRRIAASDDMITRCLVTLDRSGKLVKVQIIGNSGVIELDEAAVEAFRSAAPFPNPPSGMVDGDGTIKIRWDFILEA